MLARCATFAITLTLLLALPIAAHANSTITYDGAPGGDLSWMDEAAAATTITVSFAVNGAGTADDQLVLTSTGNITVLAPAAGMCPIGGGTTTVRCSHRDAGTAVGQLFLNALDQNDVITMDPSMSAANLATTTPVLWGGTGSDTITGSGKSDEIQGGDGIDYLDGRAGSDTIAGGAGNDYLTGGTGADILNGGDGDDQIQPDAGFGSDGSIDVIDGGEGAESQSGDLVILGSGWGSGVNVTLADGLANDGPGNENYGATIEGVDGTDYDDMIVLGNDAGIVYGNAGDDTITGGAGSSTLHGGAGNDTMNGGPGDDVLYGDQVGPVGGNDLLDGGAGADQIYGRAGDDVIRNVLDGSIDSFDGGEQGEINGDTVTYAGSDRRVTVHIGIPGESGGIGELENIDTSIENVVGTSFGDELQGASGDDNTLRGGVGSDTLRSVGDADVLIGGAGADTYEHVGISAATVSFAEDSGPVQLSGLTATVPEGQEQLAASHRTIIGSPFGDTLTPAAAVVTVRSGGGDDVIDVRDGLLELEIDCGAGAADVARFDTVANGGVDDPAPINCESLNPVAPTPIVGTDPVPDAAIATRLTAPSARLVRVRCTRAQQRLGVREGRRRWCYQLVATVRLVRAATGVSVRGQRVNVYRIVGRRQLLVRRAVTNARGVATVRRAVVVPARYRTGLRAANRWLATFYRTTRLGHSASGNYSVAAPKTVKTLR